MAGNKETFLDTLANFVTVTFSNNLQQIRGNIEAHQDKELLANATTLKENAGYEDEVDR